MPFPPHMISTQLIHTKRWTNLIRPQFFVTKQHSPKFDAP